MNPGTRIFSRYLPQRSGSFYFNDVCVGGVCCRKESVAGSTTLQNLYIATLGVLAPYRRLGLGTKLLNHILETANEAATAPKIGKIYLHVQFGNDEALEFYKKYGFEVVETCENYYPQFDIKDAHTPPILSSTFFGWIPQLLRIPEAEVLDCVGLDAVMMLRFYTMAVKLFALCFVPGLLVILPVNYFSSHSGIPAFPGADDDDDDDGFFNPSTDAKDRVSLLVLFTRFTFTWVFSLLTLYTIWHTYEGYIDIRRKYMLKREKSITNRTVMVVGLPTHLQSERALATFYESLGVGEVDSAHVCRHVRMLKKLIEQREHALRALEEAYTDYYGNPSGVPSYDSEAIYAENDRKTVPMPDNNDGINDDDHADDENASLLRTSIPGKKRLTMRLGFMGLFGKKVDRINHRREVFATLDKAVLKMRMSRVYAKTSIGFVTFEEMHSAQILAQTVNTHETLSCITTLAPEPRDVFWDNLNIPPSELGVRSIVVNTTVFFLVFFWAGPVGVFSSFLNLESLEKLIPGITAIAGSSPIIKSLIQGFLPTLGVTIFLAVVPKILEGLCIGQGIQSHSEISRSIYNKYFTFILVNVVLVFTLVGTWAQSINKVYRNVGELALVLAVSLPRVAPFFVNYIILKGIGLLPLQLLQIGEVFQQTAKGFLSKTPRDYAESRAPPDLKYGVVYSNSTLTFVIVLIYSCIQPMILAFGAAYFAIGVLVYKYQLLYVFFHPNESGGLTWPMVYNRIILGLLIFQTMMLGLFVLKQSYMLGVLIVPLMVGTTWFWYWTTSAYENTAKFIPLELLRREASKVVQLAQAKTVANGNGSTVSVSGGPKSAVAAAAAPQQQGAANTVVAPGVTQRRIPKSVVDDDDYQAIPDRYTDYRQPPMTLFAGVLNSGMRHYNHPAIAGPLPTLWLPVKKSAADDNKKPQDEESAIGGHQHHHRPHLPGRKDSDSDDENHVHSIENALAKPPLKLPTRESDEPQTFDEGDNLVGGGQDEDQAQPTPASASNAPAAGAPATSTAASTQDVKLKSKDSKKPAKQTTVPGVATSNDVNDETETITILSREATVSKVIEQNHNPAATSKPAPALVPTSIPMPAVRTPQAAKGNGASDNASICTGGPSPVGSPMYEEESPLAAVIVAELESGGADQRTLDSKRQSAVYGVNDVYYHHPEKRLSGSSVKGKGTAPRTVQGQVSGARLIHSTTTTSTGVDKDQVDAGSVEASR
ncbi:hypothetical protein BG004_001497 [Podila humilis]|nr:hypothetical protein BG004_001497 [Podila humilis]